MGGSSASNPLPTPTGRAGPPGCRHRRNAGSAASRPPRAQTGSHPRGPASIVRRRDYRYARQQHAGHRSRGRGPVLGGRERHLVCDREHGDLGSGRPKGAARCPIESRKRGAVKSGCHAGFDACSGDRTLLETGRKPPTRSGKLNLGGRSPRTRIGRPWACCLSCTARVGRSAASSSSANRTPASPARYGASGCAVLTHVLGLDSACGRAKAGEIRARALGG
jgi:hypothetical protein